MRYEEPLSEDVLPIAMTRPAMRFGLPLALLLPLGGVGYALLMLIPGWISVVWCVCVVAPLGVVARLLVAIDYNFPGLALRWAVKAVRCFDNGLYGGASVAPLPVAERGHVVRGMRHVG